MKPALPMDAAGGSAQTAAVYRELKPLMFSIAYRMLGSVTDAEDIVQEAFLRYHRAVADSGQPESLKAYLSAITTRLCIDQLRSARSRREAYVGEWLPEPLLTRPAELAQLPIDPAEHAEQADSLSMAFLLLLERLTPLERAVFLLHDVFGYGYGETADIVGRGAATCRQLAHRARQHIEADRPRFEADTRHRDELAARFFDAIGNGDMDGLLDLLAADAEVHGDAGGVPPFWRKPIRGRDHVGRLLIALAKQLHAQRGSLRLVEVNGQPGALAIGPDGSLIGVLGIDIVGGRVQVIRSVISRQKLRHLGPLADLNSLLKRSSAGNDG